MGNTKGITEQKVSLVLILTKEHCCFLQRFFYLVVSTPFWMQSAEGVRRAIWGSFGIGAIEWPFAKIGSLVPLSNAWNGAVIASRRLRRW